MRDKEYLGPLCRHVCMTYGGCDRCCGGHDCAICGRPESAAAEQHGEYHKYQEDQ